MAIALLAGVLVARLVSPGGGLLLAAGAIFSAAAVWCAVRRPGRRITTAAVLGVVFVAGAARYWLAVTPLDPAHLSRFATDQPILAHLTGVVVTEPHARRLEESLLRATFFAVEAEALGSGAFSRRAAGRVLVVVHEDVTDVHCGDRVRMVGRLIAPSPPTNPGQRVRPGRPLAAVLTTDHREAVVPIPGGPFRGAPRLIALLRRQMARTVSSHLHPEHRAVMLALLIGDRWRIERDLKRSFAVTGTMHLLAISGLHVGLVAAMTWGLLRLVGVPPRPAYLLVLAAALLYGAVTGWHAPTVRACAMIGVITLGALLRRDVDLLNSLALAAVLVVFLDPFDLFRAGFHLSFVATLGLVLFVRPVDQAVGRATGRLFARWRDRRRLAAAAGRHRPSIPPRWRRALRQTVIVSIVAWVVTAPLSAYYFGRVAWLCPLATLAASPLLWLALSSGLVMCAASLLNAAHLVAPLTGTSLGLLGEVVGAFARLPGSGALDRLRPTTGMLVLYYGALVLVALRGRLGVPPRRVALAVGITAAGLAWTVALFDPAPAGLEVTLLEVGHGQCAILRTPEGHTVLLDAGSLTRAGGAWRTVADALVALRVRRIDLAVLSHPDHDHFSALPGLLEEFPIGAVVVPQRFFDSAEADARQVLRTLKEAGVPTHTAAAGEAITGLEPLTLEVLHPGAEPADWSDNDLSLVIRAVHGSTGVLVTGDLQERGIAALLSRRRDLAADVLIAPHHGRYEGNLAWLVAAVRPALVAASGPATPRTVQGLAVYRSAGATALLTGEVGAITILGTAGGLEVRTWRTPRLWLRLPRRSPAPASAADAAQVPHTVPDQGPRMAIRGILRPRGQVLRCIGAGLSIQCHWLGVLRTAYSAEPREHRAPRGGCGAAPLDEPLRGVRADMVGETDGRNETLQDHHQRDRRSADHRLAGGAGRAEFSHPDRPIRGVGDSPGRARGGAPASADA